MALPQLLDAFANHFGREPTVIIRAPGRVNLLGEHTDYNEGFALPFAIEAALLIALRPRDDKTIRVHSEAFAESREFAIDSDEQAIRAASEWASYLWGVIREFRERGMIATGADVLIHGSLPLAMGLSSSAALTVGFVKGYATLCREVLDTDEMIGMCIEVERRLAGVPCGMLDQTTILNAQSGHVMFLDCRSGEISQLPLSRGDSRFLTIDTKQPRRLAATGYARRRRECEAALEYFSTVGPNVRGMRDVTADLVKRHASQTSAAIALRALHVATENERVLAGALALKKEDWAAFGRLMNESHDSLRDNFEASTPVIDALVSAVQECNGVFGARLTGGGFGGAIIALADRDAATDIKEAVAPHLPATKADDVRLQWVYPGDGVSILRS